MIVTATSSAFTITLPWPANTGELHRIQRTDTTLNYLVTLATGGTDKFSSASGPTSVNLATANESWTVVWDGTYWQILNHETVTAWNTYSPTLAGLGTVSNNNFYWRRVGSEMEIRGTVAAGTVNGPTLFSMTLPTNITLDTNVISPNNTTSNPGMIVGHSQGMNVANSLQNIVTATGTSTSLLYGADVLSGVTDHDA